MTASASRASSLIALALALATPHRAAAMPVARSLAELQTSLAKAASGRTAVVHFWASWCEACVSELPQIRELAAALVPASTPLVFVSLDEAADAEKAEALLAQVGLGQHPSLRLEAPDPQAVTPAFDKRWQAELPATFLRLESGAIAASYLGPTPVKRILEDLCRGQKTQPKGKLK